MRETEMPQYSCKVFRSFIPDGSRYLFDSELSAEEGWCQVDTPSDAWYFGIWCNPFMLQLVYYTEGDYAKYTYETVEGFLHHLRSSIEHHRKDGKSAVDTMCVDKNTEWFIRNSASDLLHNK